MNNEGIDYLKLTKEINKDENSLLYTIPSFQNPTNIIMSENRRKELLSFCNKNMIPIIEDDAYGELFIDNIPPKPIKSIDNNGIVLYTGSISKTLAPGMRIGWIVGPQSVIKRLGDAKMQIDYGVSLFSQWFLYESYSTGLYDKYMEEVRDKLRNRRDIMIKNLEDNFSDIAIWNKPTGGFYIWVKFNKDINTEKLFYKAVSKKVLINPGSIYGASNKNYVRLSYAYENIDKMIEGLKIIRNIIDEHLIRS